jgi:hypothetical protein
VLVNVETIQDLHWIDSYQALIVPFLATALGTFLLRQVFLTIPTELREAAALDGLGPGDSSPVSQCPWPGPPSARSACSRSWRPGTSTCGPSG